jgi:hypothetical protein
MKLLKNKVKDLLIIEFQVITDVIGYFLNVTTKRSEKI